MEARAPTLDQLRVFIIVAETGSFSAAAKRLNRTQSVISYTMTNLEAQLGVALFDRTTRHPTLTETGWAILADAKAVAQRTDEMVARIHALSQGLEPHLDVAIDVMYPMEQLTTVLHGMRAQYPTVGLTLFSETLGGVANLVLTGRCRVGVSCHLYNLPEGLTRENIGAIRLITVAAPFHPLATASDGATGKLSANLLAGHNQLVLTDRTELSNGTDYAVLAPHNWRIADFTAKYAFIRAGLGWGNLPEWLVADDIAKGQLIELDPTVMPFQIYSLYAIYRADTPPGPAARWLLDKLRLPGPKKDKARKKPSSAAAVQTDLV